VTLDTAKWPAGRVGVKLEQTNMRSLCACVNACAYAYAASWVQSDCRVHACRARSHPACMKGRMASSTHSLQVHAERAGDVTVDAGQVAEGTVHTQSKPAMSAHAEQVAEGTVHTQSKPAMSQSVLGRLLRARSMLSGPARARSVKQEQVACAVTRMPMRLLRRSPLPTR